MASYVLPAGVSTAHDGITLSSAAIVYLAYLRRAVPAQIPIVVTSGTRSVAGQARAMLTKASTPAGRVEMLKNYNNDLLRELFAAPATEEAWTPIVQRAYADGRLSRAGHLAGLALDLRTSNLLSWEQDALERGVEATGGKVLREAVPPHFHVTIPKTPREAPRGSTPGLGFVLLLGLGLGAYALSRRHR